MGSFSWKFADDDSERLLIGHQGYLLTPDNHCLYTGAYDGYGRFFENGSSEPKDVYELVTIWNRDRLSRSMLESVEINPKYCRSEEDFDKIKEGFFFTVNRLMDYKSRQYSDEQMREKYGNGWLRLIGIDIACSDDQNSALPYPIKIVSKKGLLYDDLPASMMDPLQGDPAI